MLVKLLLLNMNVTFEYIYKCLTDSQSRHSTAPIVYDWWPANKARLLLPIVARHPYIICHTPNGTCSLSSTKAKHSSRL